MINIKLEECLQEWCQSNDSDFFGKYLYEAFCYYASSICLKLSVPSSQIEDITANAVSQIALIMPDKFKEKKRGTAKAFLYVSLTNHIKNQLKYNSRNKRKTIFIEEMEGENGIVSLLEIEMDDLEKMKLILLKNKHLFEVMDTKLQTRIAKKIIKLIETSPEIDNYIKHISKLCDCSLNEVYKVIKIMHQKLVLES